MNKKVLSFVNKLEGYKTAIKELHWDADNMSQHELCDKIAESIAEFQDTVSEVEQSITGKLATGNLKPVSYKVTTLKKFVEDVLDATNSFYKSIEDEGDTYTGMRSDCESFLSDMQRNLYLVNFTMKEDLKRRLSKKINESFRKEENEKKFNIGRHTENLTDGGMAKRISDIIKNSQFNKRPFDSISDCVERCQRTFSKAGDLHVIGKTDNVVFLQLDAHNGYSYYGQIVISDSNADTGGVVCTVSFNPSGIKSQVQEPEPSPEGAPLEDGTDHNMYEIHFQGKEKMNESINAHDIFRQVRNEIFDLKNTGELEVPICPNDMYVPTSEDFLKAYFQDEDKITVEYNGRKMFVDCNINADDDIIARCIMNGFARIIKGHMSESVVRMTGSEFHNLIKESVKRVLREGYNDNAFKFSRNLDDFDRSMNFKDEFNQETGDIAQGMHPQTNTKFFSDQYAKGLMDLDDMEDETKTWRKINGF